MISAHISKNLGIGINLITLRYLYEKKPDDIMVFVKKYVDNLKNQKTEPISYFSAYSEIIKKYESKVKEAFKINNRIDIDLSFEIFVKNLALSVIFKDSNLKLDESAILGFIKEHWNIFRNIRILSNHEIYRKSDYVKQKGGLDRIVIEPDEFVFSNFKELFTNDIGFGIGIFIFLDSVIKSYNDELGMFNDIHKAGKELFEAKITEEDIDKIISLLAEGPVSGFD